MKSTVFSVLFLLVFVCATNAQGLVMTFAEAGANDISIEEIDDRYIDALHSEPEFGLFNRNSEAFINEYRAFIVGLAGFLNSNDFYWEEPTRIFSRIYFSADGKVDYFFLNEAQANLSDDELATFVELTSKYISDYSIGISSDQPFAQCSPVVYNNVMDKEG